MILSVADLLILLAGDLIFPLRIFFVVPSFSSRSFSNFWHLETSILGVTGVEQPRVASCFLEEDLRHMVVLVVSLSWKLEVLLAMLETEDLSWEHRKEEVSSWNYHIFASEDEYQD